VSPQLATSYLGLDLANPLLASPSPLTGDLSQLRALEDSGVAAVVLPSLFEEEIEHDAKQLQGLDTHGGDSFAEALTGYLPDFKTVETSATRQLRLVEDAKATLSIPVVASLNGTSLGGWTSYATRLAEAGADALELNIYLIPTDPAVAGAQVEERYIELVGAVRGAVEIPLAVKIGPYFSSLAEIANRLEHAGADALVLFNRFYQPDIDLDRLDVVPSIVLSSPAEMRLPLRWVALLSEQLRCDLAVTTGVHDGRDVVKALLVGADVAMTTSALLTHGPGHVATMLEQLSDWLDEHDYESVAQLRGAMSMSAAEDPEAYMRANYIETLYSYGDPSP
jgi:dihydroorotate dehydrogenase (fumarate)